MAISLALYNQCRTILLKCPEFSSTEQLRSVFVTPELRIFLNGLPDCVSASDRVTQTIAYLLPLRLIDKRFVFPVFLSILRDNRDHNDELHGQLKELVAAVDEAVLDSLTVPVIIVAMNHTQAKELFSEEIFANPSVTLEERDRFRQLREMLPKAESVDIASHYGPQRESWKPFFHGNTEISQVIRSVVDHINQTNRLPSSLPALIPEFLSDEFFSDDKSIRRPVLNRLSSAGGVLVIDAVSLFHPLVSHRIASSAVSGIRRVAILVVSPIDAGTLPVNLLVDAVLNRRMETTLARFEEDLDRFCEVGAGNLTAIRRWLFTILPDAAAGVRSDRPNPTNLSLFRQSAAREPQGIQQAFYGGGVVR